MSFVGIMNDFVDECVLMEKQRVLDGEGGWYTDWVDGATFNASITHDDTIQARVAESQGMRSTYTVSLDKGMPLDYHDVFRRVRDGQVFRVTSDSTDKVSPATSTFEFCQVKAEEWVLA